jgi:purine-binding chemotaxis protein CheW
MNQQAVSVSEPANPASDAAAAGLVEYISFAIGNHYGADIMAVHEIKEWSNVTHLPKQPEYALGVLNLHGGVMQVVDLRCCFGEGQTEPTPTHINIVQIDERQVWLLADRVRHRLVRDERDSADAAHDATTDFLSGLVSHDDTMIALIDLSRLFSMPEIAKMN